MGSCSIDYCLPKPRDCRALRQSGLDVSLIGPDGLEPSFPDPKSGVLPLDEGPAVSAPELIDRSPFAADAPFAVDKRFGISPRVDGERSPAPQYWALSARLPFGTCCPGARSAGSAPGRPCLQRGHLTGCPRRHDTE